MKKLLVKTSFITLGVSFILLLSVFGVLSLCVPNTMSNFTRAIGLDSLSGDYAFQEYERSGDIEYLARSFEIAATCDGARKANERFELLIADENFEELCKKRDADMAGNASVSKYNYKDSVYGLGARIKYRLAKTEAEQRRVCEFAIDHTDDAFGARNPIVLLTYEVVSKRDAGFCNMLLGEIESSNRDFNRESEDYQYIVKTLKGIILEGVK